MTFLGNCIQNTMWTKKSKTKNKLKTPLLVEFLYEHPLLKPGTLVSFTTRCWKWLHSDERSKIRKALHRTGGHLQRNTIFLLLDEPWGYSRVNLDGDGGLVDVYLPLLIGEEAMIVNVTCHIPDDTHDVLSLILRKRGTTNCEEEI